MGPRKRPGRPRRQAPRWCLRKIVRARSAPRSIPVINTIFPFLRSTKAGQPGVTLTHNGRLVDARGERGRHAKRASGQ